MASSLPLLLGLVFQPASAVVDLDLTFSSPPGRNNFSNNGIKWRYPDSSSISSANASEYYTAYHPQALKNWLNDPNGPMFFGGSYHLFFQYNPESYYWGDMHWYHMISTDLMHWKHLPVALAPDKSYDCGGIFSGSATIVNGIPVLTYSVPCQKAVASAIPADMSDKELQQWRKPDYNPIAAPPTTMKNYRDPSEGFLGSDGMWRMVTVCDGGPCMFKSKDFIHWSYAGRFWKTLPHECPDLFPMPENKDVWLFKLSVVGRDWWVLGKLDERNGLTTTDNFTRITADFTKNNQLLDMGRFYASKTFFDAPNNRRVLFGWVNYHCAGTDWSGVQTFPRVVSIEKNSNPNWITTYPIPEISNLHANTSFDEKDLSLRPGTFMTFANVGSQIDIVARFNLNKGKFMKFGLRVFADPDASRANSLQIDIRINEGGAATLQGHPINIYESDEAMELRVLVDRSLAESFVQGGRHAFTNPFCALKPQDMDRMGVEAYNDGVAGVDFDITIHQMQTANVMPTH